MRNSISWNEYIFWLCRLFLQNKLARIQTKGDRMEKISAPTKHITRSKEDRYVQNNSTSIQKYIFKRMYICVIMCGKLRNKYSWKLKVHDRGCRLALASHASPTAECTGSGCDGGYSGRWLGSEAGGSGIAGGSTTARGLEICSVEHKIALRSPVPVPPPAVARPHYSLGHLFGERVGWG